MSVFDVLVVVRRDGSGAELETYGEFRASERGLAEHVAQRVAEKHRRDVVSVEPRVAARSMRGKDR